MAEWLLLQPRMNRARGYFFAALRRAWLPIAQALFARFVAAWLALFLSRLVGLQESWVLGLVCGVAAVLLPKGYETLLGRTVSATSRPAVRVLTRLNLLTGQVFWSTVQSLKEQDNYEIQAQVGRWNLGVGRIEATRRLRLLSEHYKLEIADRLREPRLMRLDVDFFPAQMFSLLVSHLGRESLRRQLEHPPPSPPPGRNWDGRERRRRVGTAADRLQPDPNPLRIRSYDNPELMQRLVDSGEQVTRYRSILTSFLVLANAAAGFLVASVWQDATLIPYFAAVFGGWLGYYAARARE